jgi:serine protease Do
MERGDADEGAAAAAAEFRAPPPPDDRLWRHPSEVDPSLSPPPRRRRSRDAGPWATPLVSGLVGSVLTFALVASTGALDRPARDPVVIREVTAPLVPTSGAPEPDRVVRIAEEAGPAIARIDVDGDQPGTGSGVMLRDDGYVLTNAHVVDGARSIQVVMADGAEHDGELVGSDEVTDIAVVKIDGHQPFPVAVFGSAAELRVGQTTVAIGSPLGLIGGSSVTTGVVSALGRRVSGRDGPVLLDMIQTDAAIAPGSSGGALLDGTGAVIGITTAIAVSEVGAEGLGFATPVDIARSVADDIIATGSAVHVWLGVEGRDLDDASAEEAGIPGGAAVVSVVDGGPAAIAGLAAGDVALILTLRRLRPGDGVDLGVLRGGERRTVGVTLGARPPPEP